jgi:predicted CoA-binding protein
VPSAYEEFWTNSSFAFVGHSAKQGFPKLSYGEAKKLGRTVYAVDPSVSQIAGDQTYPNLESLPTKVDAVVLEVPREETIDLVRQAAEAGIRNVWIHANRETPEAVGLAREEGMNVLTGTCAVMYLKRGFSYHSLHKWVNQLVGKY